MRELDASGFPLIGNHLIEASAGTGKTWTIAALYTRLVLGHGEVEGVPAPALMPPNILVVTFTEAATEELRERIRARLVEAAEAFLAPDVPDEPFLSALRASYPAERHPACARRLRQAAEWMDEAAVSTIHGWCQRMLREHAFDSGSLFATALESDTGHRRADAVRDYWRRHFHPLPAPLAQWIMAWWPQGPDQLAQALEAPLRLARQGVLPQPPAGGSPEALPETLLADLNQTQRQHLDALKAPWGAWAEQLRGIFDAGVAKKQVNGRKFQARWYGPWLEALASWAADAAAVWPSLGDSAWERLTPTGVAEIWTQGEAPAHPALDAFAALKGALEGLSLLVEQARLAVLSHAAGEVGRALDEDKARRATLDFDDLLLRLREALQGPGGARLARTLRCRFPVAMIDEFQDTDPVQYAIFERVYLACEAGDEALPPGGLILIGDPKQAIYGFRGADIYTYLAARRAVGGQVHTLTTNYRATDAMVEAVNDCFLRAEQRVRGAGAFLFRPSDGGDNPVPFHPARARGRSERFRRAGQWPPALSLVCLACEAQDQTPSKTQYRTRLASACAEEVFRLLNDDTAGFEDAAGGWTPLRPADIAVLVATGDEARAVRGELAQRGLRSVYLSERESVYRSAVAIDLQRWLRACAEPDDGTLLRAALASDTLGLAWDTLAGLGRDDLVWEDRVLQFRGYRDLWRRQGVLPMLRRLIHDFDVPARLLTRLEGERRLTDLLHLCELMQLAAGELDGEHALIRHLAECIARPDVGDTEALRLRLESDADLVRVVTVHKSKGLEYPLVFLPFAADFRPVDTQKPPPYLWHDAQGRAQSGWVLDADILERMDDERLGEDLRKLYVALTRARHHTWVGLAPLAGFERGAFGYLLAEDEERAEDGAARVESLVDRLKRVLGGCPAIHIEALPAEASAPVAEQAPRPRAAGGPHAPALGPARQPVRAPAAAWWIASYSALKAGEKESLATGAAAQAETARQWQLVEESEAEGALARLADEPGAAPSLTPVPPVQTQALAALHAFARGPGPGSLLHELFELCAGQGFAALAGQTTRLEGLIAPRCTRYGLTEWTPTLAPWLAAFLHLPLALPGGGAVALAALSVYRAELEFWLPAERVDAGRLDALVGAQVLPGRVRPPLPPRQLSGMLKGFVDLVFEHEGRHYVLDYKSNHLGPALSDYHAEAVITEVLAHRYELQYSLYLFALHRHLRARLPDYDYDRHVGGALYPFLRGVAPGGWGVHVDRPPRALMEALDGLFTDGEGNA